MKENMDKINRIMIGLEKILSKLKVNSPFQSNLQKELLPMKTMTRKLKGKIDKEKNRQLSKGKTCTDPKDAQTHL